jgi:hypothetical protein
MVKSKRCNTCAHLFLSADGFDLQFFKSQSFADMASLLLLMLPRVPFPASPVFSFPWRFLVDLL